MIRMIPADDLAAARAAILEDGVVVLRDAVDLTHVEALRLRMHEDLPRVLARADIPFNFNSQHVQQSPPRERELLFQDVLLNEYVIAITSSLMP